MRHLFPFAIFVSFLFTGCASKTPTDTPAPAPKAVPMAEKAKAELKTAEKTVKAEAAKATAAVSAVATAEGKVECAHGGDARILEVRKKDSGCELAYTKNGQEAVVSTAVHGTSHCDGTLTKIKDKLVGAGFTCK